MVISKDLISCVNNILDGIPNDLQSDPIFLGNPRLPALDDVFPNLGDGLIPSSGIRLGGGEKFIRTHDPQLDEGALEW